MKNGNQSAFARPYSRDEHSGDSPENHYPSEGLTKREYTAIKVLSAMVMGYSEKSKVNDRYIAETDYKELAKESIAITDEILKQLEG